MNKDIIRCPWCSLKNINYINYHDNEWGMPCHDDKKLYEYFILETFQAGLSWETILNKREAFRIEYDNFDIDSVCAFDEEKIATMMQDKNIIRNGPKIRASINNSRIFRKIQAEFGSFDAYLSRFYDDIIYENDYSITVSPLSDSISRDLKKRGMAFVGSTTIYAYLQAIGIINAHSKECFRFTGKK